jgi:hypothetical protein
MENVALISQIIIALGIAQRLVTALWQSHSLAWW